MPPSTGSISLRAWAWLVLAATTVLCGGIAAFNAVVDPTAQLGSGVLEPVAAGPRDRTAKVQLLERDPRPPLVVLGSSRSKKLDPAWLLPEHDGINAAVVGGDLFEARVLTAWLAKRAQRSNGRMPILVVGVDVEQFRDSSLQGSGFLDVPSIAATARHEAGGSDGSLGDEVDRVGRLLLTWQVTKASLASVRSRGRGAGGGDADAPGREESGFTETGVPTADARWFDPAQAARFARATPGRIEHNIDELRATYASNGATLDADAVEDLRALVRIVRDTGGAGQPLLFYVTPANPALVDELGPLGRDERTRRVLQLLQEVDPYAIVVDCTDCIGADDVNWIDATHPSPIGARMLADRLNDPLPGPVPARPGDAGGQAPSATPTERSGESR